MTRDAASTSRPVGCVLAFDFGLRHIGVAVGQHITRSASPLTTVRARDGSPDWAAIDALIREWHPAQLLVGLPLNMDASESDMSRLARRFAERLGARARLPVALVDERLTSVAARESQPARADSHALAAVLIAEGWLGAD
jgi:putative Holliday junction resolvase